VKPRLTLVQFMVKLL